MELVRKSKDPSREGGKGKGKKEGRIEGTKLQ